MSEAIQSHPQIHTLIGKAMGEIGAISKDKKSTNASGKVMYSFRGIDDVYNALNPVMAKYGLFVTPEILDQKREERKTASGGALIYTILTIRFSVFAPDGSSVSMTVIGEAMDSGDKSTNKAMSIALKYAMFQLFMIPTEDIKDPDAEVHEPILPRNQTTQAVTVKQQTVPPVQKATEAPNPNTVDGYLQNELVFMAQRMGFPDKKTTTAKFAEMRKAVIAAGLVPDKPRTEMTLDEAKALVAAIYETFLPGGIPA